MLSYSIRVLESNIFLSKSVRNLGISMDRDLTMLTQISKTIQTCFTSASNKIHQGVRKYDHITPVLKEPHWLKIYERIEYTIALQMYTCLSNESSAYLTRDLVPVARMPKNKD